MKLTGMLATVEDSQHLKLEAAIPLPVGIQVRIFVEDPNDSADEEREDWLRLSAQGLAAAYGDDEPEYTEADIIEPNPEFRPR
jgi:hypothetical protein